MTPERWQLVERLYHAAAAASPDVRAAMLDQACGGDDRIKCLPSNRVAADDELLGTIDAHLLPSAGPQARLVATVAALRDEALQPLCLHGGDQFRQLRVQLGKVTDWLGEFREDLPLKQLTPCNQWLSSEIPSRDDHDVEHEG